ncbi:patatin-like phospholipase family protein [Acholeplasma equirhinis]|uniref:patatin-like phospholipase family protein n=1 Tax=Acholeplasma equirhinis TaxID=555393 RepID=UPI00197AFFE7|nr:patatin-like phospholipase family protein [Acholeplasma equirhinis]MBN3490617.1 patatin-like phospholipase family protein [Acholeplasma equirhinis]
MGKLKIGLMLGGGGAKGAYQLGVIKALEEANLLKQIKSISGTSIGAINTMLLMSKKNHKHMETIWDDLDADNVFGVKMNVFSKDSRMYSVEPLTNKLLEKINMKQVRKSKYQGYATAALMYSKTSMTHQINTDTMEKKVFHLNKMMDPYKAVLASASIPVIFGPTKIDDFFYVDGGILDNYPVEPLINDGCNLILSIPLDYKFNPYLYDHTDINIIDFTPGEVFEKSFITDNLEMLNFNKTYKDEKALLGYTAGKMVINKMYEEGIIKSFWKFNFFKKSNEFKVIKLTPEDELKLKDLKLQTKKELKKLQKEMKKKAKKQKRGNEE